MNGRPILLNFCSDPYYNGKWHFSVCMVFILLKSLYIALYIDVLWWRRNGIIFPKHFKSKIVNKNLSEGFNLFDDAFNQRKSYFLPRGSKAHRFQAPKPINKSGTNVSIAIVCLGWWYSVLRSNVDFHRLQSESLRPLLWSRIPENIFIFEYIK